MRSINYGNCDACTITNFFNIIIQFAWWINYLTQHDIIGDHRLYVNYSTEVENYHAHSAHYSNHKLKYVTCSFIID